MPGLDPGIHVIEAIVVPAILRRRVCGNTWMAGSRSYEGVDGSLMR
jgi:hypothetical protein